MKITIVGERNGKAVIHWPGLLLASGVVVAINLVVIAVFFLVTKWFSPTVLCGLPISLFSLIGLGVFRALQLPRHELTTLD